MQSGNYPGFYLKRTKNTWHSIASGYFTDPSIWAGTARHKYKYPQPGDDVFINTNVTVDMNVTTQNLTVNGKLYVDTTARTITVNGRIQAVYVNLSTAAHSLVLNGYNNWIHPAGFTAGTSSTVTYGRTSGAQLVMNLSYFNLTLDYGVKYLTANLTLPGNLNGTNLVYFELGNYDLNVTGTTNINGSISKTGAGSIIFGGNANTLYYYFSGNPTLQFKNGWTSNFGVNQGCISGTGAVNFSDNSQTWSGGQVQSFSGNITITGAIKLTLSVYQLNLSGTMNGTVSGSELDSRTSLYYGNTTKPMTMGIMTLNAGSNVFIYDFAGDVNLWNFNYYGIGFNQSGIKTAQQHLILPGALLGSAAGTLEMGTYNLTVGAASTMSSAFTLSKSGAGTVLFTGNITFGKVNFSGNPTIESRNGCSFSSGNGANVYFGTGDWNVTTNSQTFNMSQNATIDAANFIIANNITLTLSSATGILTIMGVLSGATSTAVYDNRGITNYQHATAPMATGKLYCNQATNTFIYGKSGNQDIKVPSDPVPGYKNLTLNGSGAKKLLGNVSVKGAYLLTPPATLNANGFSLTTP